MSNREVVKRSIPSVVVLSLLGACAGETVDLGGGQIGQELTPGSRCAASPIVGESVRVTDQAELDALAGCEEIQGDLKVDVFAGADLAPLASLRVVGGGLVLGAFPQPPGSDMWSDAQSAELRGEVEQVADAGYLESLAGLEALERVGSLELDYVGAPTLAPLLHVRSLGSHRDGPVAGTLLIHDAPNLSDLDGLQNALGLSDLVLVDNPALESIEGVVVGTELRNVNILNSPILSELGSLGELQRLSSLYLDNVGIRNLDPLSNLIVVEFGIDLEANQELEQVDALAHLQYAGPIVVAGNPKLSSFPSLPNLGGLTELMVKNNPSLATLSLELPPFATDGVVDGHELDTEVRFFDISDNASLRSISLTAGLVKAGLVAIYGNAALESVALGTLTSLESLTIEGNPSLTALDLGAIETVEELSVVHNERLSTAGLESVRTFETVLSGNAAAAAP